MKSEANLVRRVLAKTLRVIQLLLFIFNMTVGGVGAALILWPIAEFTSGSGESFGAIIHAWVNSIPKGLGLVALALVAFSLIRGIDWILENTLAPPE